VQKFTQEFFFEAEAKGPCHSHHPRIPLQIRNVGGVDGTQGLLGNPLAVLELQELVQGVTPLRIVLLDTRLLVHDDDLGEQTCLSIALIERHDVVVVFLQHKLSPHRRVDPCV